VKHRIHAAVLAIALLTPLPALAQEPACAKDPLFAQQDFTLGHWDVFNADRKSAEVLMERALDGCAIHETWSSPDGSKVTGLGLFNYSRILKAWSYAWAASSGASTIFQGSLIEPGHMRYVTERPGAGGATRVRHWDLIALPDGRVRELSVATEDGGTTWATEYDLMWVRKAGQ
jgi:hypothetical protein